MYTQEEKQNRQGARHSRENGNPVGWIPAFAGMTANINLKKLSNNQLLSQTKNLVQKPRKTK